MCSEFVQPCWGLLPEKVRSVLKQKEWHKSKNLKARLKGSRPFPLQVTLKPPQGRQILEDMAHFQQLVAAWKEVADTENPQMIEVCWQQNSYRHLSEQNIPFKLIIHSAAGLARFLGESEESQLHDWQKRLGFILAALTLPEEKIKILFGELVDQLEVVTDLNNADLELLLQLIPQLTAGMGQGGYLRALAVTNVDTKFIENNSALIEAILSAIHGEAVKDKGLLTWLDCKPKPKDWLLVKPLCDKTKAALGGLPLLRLSSGTLNEYELPAVNILIIENEQAGLALDSFPDTIAVSGGGKNLTWLSADWLSGKRVGYWGDIDSEGFSILSAARARLSCIQPLMMDAQTVEMFQSRMVEEPESVLKEPLVLTDAELTLFRNLRERHYGCTRLEQERLPLDYVRKNLYSWLIGYSPVEGTFPK